LKGKGKCNATTKSSSSATNKSSAARVAKITNAIILHSMQGTMNWVTDIFKKLVTQPVDQQASTQDETLDYSQTREDGLSLTKQRKLVNLFMKDVVIMQTYNRLVNEDLRWGFIANMSDHFSLIAPYVYTLYMTPMLLYVLNTLLV
jgi:hypothetical protein